jgi:hypothetical protein
MKGGIYVPKRPSQGKGSGSIWKRRQQIAAAKAEERES